MSSLIEINNLSRTDLYKVIKSNSLENKIKEQFGKNYTNCSTDDLKNFIKKSLKDIQLDIDNNTDSSTNIEKNENASDLFVDLGLPSGIKWAKYNIGVNPNKLTKAEDWVGKYYAWGEISEKKRYDWNTYKYSKSNHDALTKYCGNVEYGYKKFKDRIDTLKLEDDIAYALDSKCKIPQKKDFDELLANTTNKFVKDYKGIKGLSGRVFKSKNNSCELFIPITGSWCDNDFDISEGDARLWTADVVKSLDYYAHMLWFDKNEISTKYYCCRCIGHCVRAILK